MQVRDRVTVLQTSSADAQRRSTRDPYNRGSARTDIGVLYVGDEAEKQALPLGEPERFFATPAYDRIPLVMLRLDRVDLDHLEELITDAWRMRAPDTLVGDLDAAVD